MTSMDDQASSSLTEGDLSSSTRGGHTTRQSSRGPNTRKRWTQQTTVPPDKEAVSGQAIYVITKQNTIVYTNLNSMPLICLCHNKWYVTKY